MSESLYETCANDFNLQDSSGPTPDKKGEEKEETKGSDDGEEEESKDDEEEEEEEEEMVDPKEKFEEGELLFSWFLKAYWVLHKWQYAKQQYCPRIDLDSSLGLSSTLRLDNFQQRQWLLLAAISIPWRNV